MATSSPPSSKKISSPIGDGGSGLFAGLSMHESSPKKQTPIVAMDVDATPKVKNYSGRTGSGATMENGAPPVLPTVEDTDKKDFAANNNNSSLPPARGKQPSKAIIPDNDNFDNKAQGAEAMTATSAATEGATGTEAAAASNAKEENVAKEATAETSPAKKKKVPPQLRLSEAFSASTTDAAATAAAVTVATPTNSKDNDGNHKSTAASSGKTSSANRSARRSTNRMIIHPQTRVLNIDVLMRLLRKFAYKTQPKVDAKYGGTKTMGVIQYIIGSVGAVTGGSTTPRHDTDMNFMPYKDLLDILEVDGDGAAAATEEPTQSTAATEASEDLSESDRVLESVLGQPGDTPTRARKAVAAFCHLLSVWGHASSRFFEQEDYKSQQSFSDLICSSFDTASELVSHGCLDGVKIRIGLSTAVTDNGDDPTQAELEADKESEYTSIINILAESVIVADLSIQKNELSAMKFLLSAGCRVVQPDEQAQLRGTHLLQTIRMFYHIYLTTDNKANRTTAKASLQQLITSVFARLVRTKVNTVHNNHDSDNTAKGRSGSNVMNHSSADIGFPSENHRDAFLVLRSLCKLSMRTLPDPNMHSHIGLQASGSNTLWDGGKAATNAAANKPYTNSTPSSSPAKAKPSSADEGAAKDEATADDNIGGNHVTDTITPAQEAVMSTPTASNPQEDTEPQPQQEIPKEHAHLIYTNAIHSALESKLLALELLHYVLDNVQFTRAFVQSCGYQFHAAIRNYLCVSLLKNCTSDNTQVVNLSLSMFVPLVHNFRTVLKNEIEAFVTNVFFVILDSKNSPLEHKSLVVRLFEEICSDAITLAEIFLNYDCDLSAVDLFHRIVNTLSKVAQLPPSKLDSSYYASSTHHFTFTAVAGAGAVREEKMRTEHRELRLDAMKALRQVLASLQASIVEPMMQQQRASRVAADNHQLLTHPLSPTNGTSLADDEKSVGSLETSSTIGTSEREPAVAKATDSSTAANLVKIYDSKKKRRKEEAEIVLRFNQKPSAGINYADKCNHINGSDPMDVASYLLKNKDVFDKTQIGEYLGREPSYQNGFALRVLNEYVNLMDFSNLLFDDAIRYYLSGFRLPGEAQKIDRIMEKFAERYTHQNPEIFPTADVAFILAFSIIMLQTDLHNPAIKEERKMTKEGFIRNNRGISEGQDLPEDFLNAIYDRIKKNPFSLKEDDDARESTGDPNAGAGGMSMVTGLPAALSPVSFFTSPYDEMDRTRVTNFQKERDHIVRTTESLLKRRRQPPAPAPATPTSTPATPSGAEEKDKENSVNSGNAAASAEKPRTSISTSLHGKQHAKFHRSKFVLSEDSGLRDEYVSPMFEVTWGPALAAFSTAMESANGTVGALSAIATDEELELAAENAAETIEVCLTGFRFAICTAGLCGNDTARDAFVLALSRFSQLGTGVLLEPRHVRCIQTMLALARDDGELLGSSWEHIFKALSEVNRFHQLFQMMARNDRAAAHAAQRRKHRLEELERRRQKRQQQSEHNQLPEDSIGHAASEELSSSAGDISVYSGNFSDTDESAIFSSEDEFDLDFDEEMDKKAIDESNARMVYEAVSEALIEAIYQRSSSLSHHAINEFILQLCRVSRMEISVKGYGGHAGNYANAVDLTQVQYRHSHELLLHHSGDSDNDDDPANQHQQFHHSQPNIYNLQKLVEVTHYNMESRPRLIFGEIWNTVSGHLTSTALHSNPAVAMYAVDSFRQLSIQYLKRKEPEVFEFQRRFLKPLETVIKRSEHSSTKELLLKCVDRIIFMFGASDGISDTPNRKKSNRKNGANTGWQNKKGNLRSGWLSILHVLGAAGNDSDEGIAKMGYSMLKKQIDECLELELAGSENPNTLLSEHFVDVVVALQVYATGAHEELCLTSIDLLISLCSYLANESVQQPILKRKQSSTRNVFASSVATGNADNADDVGVSSAENEQASSGKQQFELWWPILLALSRCVGDNRMSVRTKGLTSLFDIINQHFFPDTISASEIVTDYADEGDDADDDDANEDGASSTPPSLQTLRLIFRGILTPVLEFAETEAVDGRVPFLPEDFERFLSFARDSAVENEETMAIEESWSSAPNQSWLEATFDEFMDGCISLCLRAMKKYNDDALVEETFAILNSCLLSDSGALAVRGLLRLEQFVTSDLSSEFVNDDTWATVSHMMRRCLSVRGLPEKNTLADPSSSHSVAGSAISASVDGASSGESVSSNNKDKKGNDDENQQQSLMIKRTESTEDTINEFILEDRVLPDRRYIGSNATMVIGSLLSSDRLLEMIGMRWRLFLITGLGQAIRDWEQAAAILSAHQQQNENANSSSNPAPDYLENVIYARKWMNRFIIQLASVKEVARLPDNGADPRRSRYVSAQKIVLEQTKYLLTSFVDKEIAVSKTGGDAKAVELYKRMSNLVAELLAGYSSMESDHLKHMSWLGPVLLSSCIQSNNESVRLGVQKLVQATSPGSNETAYPPPEISSPILSSKSNKSVLTVQDAAAMPVIPTMPSPAAANAATPETKVAKNLAQQQTKKAPTTAGKEKLKDGKRLNRDNEAPSRKEDSKSAVKASVNASSDPSGTKSRNSSGAVTDSVSTPSKTSSKSKGSKATDAKSGSSATDSASKEGSQAKSKGEKTSEGQDPTEKPAQIEQDTDTETGAVTSVLGSWWS